MNEQLLTLYRFAIGMAESLVGDITDDELAHQPVVAEGQGGVNPPGWILGHLAIVNDMALAMLGREKTLPTTWAYEFGPQSEPLPQRMEAYPSKDELMTALRDTHAAVCDAVSETDLATLTERNPIGPLAKTLPTQGDLLAHILTTHIAGHLGHLSNWRRQMGRPPLF
ncbi:MAG: DinB family protein [Planctomycetota bacterium]